MLRVNCEPMTNKALQTQLLEMIFPDQGNHYGTLFGGNALHLLSKAAFISASRHARQSVVMAACGDVQFHQPVKVGQALELNARVVRSGRSSMTVEVVGMAESFATGQRHRAIDGRFEMVAVDAQGRPVALNPEFLLETP